MKTKTCRDCGETYSAWTSDKLYCGGLRCLRDHDGKVDAAASAMRIVGLRRGNWRRSALDIEPPR